jgi:hypothetical protein
MFAGNFGEVRGCRGDWRARGRKKELSDRELSSRCSEGLLGAVEFELSRCQLGLKRPDLSFQRVHAFVILVASCGLPGCESDFTSCVGSLAAAFALNCGQRVAREGLVG